MSNTGLTFDQLMQRAGPVDFTRPASSSIPPGDYQAQVADCEYKPSASGKPGWRVKFTIAQGELAGRSIRNTFYLSAESPTAVGIWLRHMYVLGVSAQNFGGHDPGDAQVAEVIRQTIIANRALATIVVNEGEYQGRKRAEVGDIGQPAAGAQPLANPGVPPGAPQIPQAPQPLAQPGGLPGQAVAQQFAPTTPGMPQVPQPIPQVPVAANAAPLVGHPQYPPILGGVEPVQALPGAQLPPAPPAPVGLPVPQAQPIQTQQVPQPVGPMPPAPLNNGQTQPPF